MNLTLFCKHNKSILLAFIIVLFLGFVITFEPEIPRIPEKEEGLPNFSFEQVLITEINDGDILWQINAEKASIFEETQEIDLRESSGDVFEDNQKIVSFQSPFALYSIGESIMTWKDAVSMLYFESKQVHVNAKQIKWNVAEQIMLGNHVELRDSNNLFVSGQRFSIDYEKNIIKLNGNVFADISSK